MIIGRDDLKGVYLQVDQRAVQGHAPASKKPTETGLAEK